MSSRLFRRKPIAAARAEHVDPQTDVEPGLRRSLGVWQLTALGVGAIIGAGIFSGAGTAVAGGPIITTILTGVFVAFFAAFANINEVIELTNIGTLFAFVLVAIGVVALRLREPERHRPFRTPLIWVVAPGAVLSCGYLMLQLPAVTWVRFGLWLVAGIVIYALYGYRRSRLRQSDEATV